MRSSIALKIIYEQPHELSGNLSLPRPAHRVVVQNAEVKELQQQQNKKKVNQAIHPSPGLISKLLWIF